MKTYSEYKDSGVFQVGKIPNHWKLIAIKHLVTTKVTDGPHETPKFVDEGIPFLSVEGVDGNKINFEKIRGYITKELHKEYSQKCKPQRDDVFLVKSGSTTGKSTIVETDKEFNIWSPLCLIRSNQKKILPRFMFTSLQSKYFRLLVELNWSFGTQPNIGMGVIENLRIVTPPLNEQQKIVAYLNNKTQKIDQLIEIKEKKIALLKEKRTALINHVVTKGLDPEVEMKDSGVEWIGEIPKHWGMKRVKYLFEIRKRISGELGYDVLSITQKGIKVKDIVTGKGQLSMDYRKYQIVEPMDFAMNHMDLLTGFVDVSKYLGVTSPDYRVFSLVDEESSHDYYLFLLQFGYINKVFYGFGQGSSMFGRWRLPAKEFLNFQFPYPPLEEQEVIVKYLNEQFDEIDKTIEFEQKKVDLLKEYRQALISEVVTGKRRVCEEDHSMQYEAH